MQSSCGFSRGIGASFATHAGNLPIEDVPAREKVVNSLALNGENETFNIRPRCEFAKS